MSIRPATEREASSLCNKKQDVQLTPWFGPEEVVLQAALGHVLVHQQELLALPAVPQQSHQIGVREPCQEIHLGLHANSTIRPHGKNNEPFASRQRIKKRENVQTTKHPSCVLNSLTFARPTANVNSPICYYVVCRVKLALRVSEFWKIIFNVSGS
jgi:hypothetical protein